MNFLLLSSESNTISFEQSWRHFFCTFSNFSKSCYYHGFHTGDAYFRTGLNVTLLGINIDYMLKFDAHVSEICKKAQINKHTASSCTKDNANGMLGFQNYKQDVTRIYK